MDSIWKEMFDCAKAVQNGRKVSEYVEAGGIGEAISAMLLTSGISTSVKLINFKDSFAEIGTVSQNYQLHGLSGEKIAATTKTLINEKGKINE